MSTTCEDMLTLASDKRVLLVAAVHGIMIGRWAAAMAAEYQLGDPRSIGRLWQEKLQLGSRGAKAYGLMLHTGVVLALLPAFFPSDVSVSVAEWFGVCWRAVVGVIIGWYCSGLPYAMRSAQIACVAVGAGAATVGGIALAGRYYADVLGLKPSQHLDSWWAVLWLPVLTQLFVLALVAGGLLIVVGLALIKARLDRRPAPPRRGVPLIAFVSSFTELLGAYALLLWFVARRSPE